MSERSTEILLGTVAIEPNRWGMVDPAWTPTVKVSEHLDTIAALGFDGIEVWEQHLTNNGTDEAERTVAHPLPISVFNSYVSFDTEDSADRDRIAGAVTTAGSRGVKFNVGNDATLEAAYGERVGAWLATMPHHVALLCECHAGISIAEDPVVAARIFDAAGPADRVQAIVHSNEDPDHVRARFDAYGERISHVHINFLDVGTPPPAPLAELTERMVAQVELLRSLGFTGSWTIEFVHGIGSDTESAATLLAQAGADLTTLREILR